MNIRYLGVSPKLLSTCVLLGGMVSPIFAVEVGGIAIHGSVSATAAYSDQYNYYGETDGKFDLIQKEITLNGGYRFENGLRASAQLYAYDLAGYSALTLDFASLDYSFNQAIGVRVGRNKLPSGFYTEVQDLDQVRIFASLPLGFYPRATRALASGYNGGAVYGNLDFGKSGGSLEYQVYAGVMNNIGGDEPYGKGLAAPGRVTDLLDLKSVFGAALVWNAPVEGLRLGYTYGFLPKLVSYGRLLVPPAVTEAEVDVATHVGSVEYTRGKWSAAAEFKRQTVVGTSTVAAFGIFKQPTAKSYDDRWYVQATYQATDELGFGVYYGVSDTDPKGTNTADDKFTTTKDLAAAASYSLTPAWLIKAEVHAIDGLGDLGIAGDLNPGATDASWTYIVLKTTFSF